MHIRTFADMNAQIVRDNDQFLSLIIR